ncbi:MAG TPA: sulfatase-like hydrolase/transferase [Verrucomicrobiae bacterium]|nr:sulfatase-like hydrolase/transferase [Verrucomicrobiae bacterium]
MRISRLLASLAATAVLLSIGDHSYAATRKPNILFIVGDDMGYSDPGFQNPSKDIPTPNLDRLAGSGVQCTSGYVSAPYCSPSRAGLLTGRYQQKFGYEFNPTFPGTGLPLDQKTIADYLKAEGYATGLVGKWHLGNTPQMHPQQRGFDDFFGFLAGSHSYFKWAGMMRGTQEVSGVEYFTDAFGDEACSFIERHKSQPWFLYLAFNAVHTPMDATGDRLARFKDVTDEKRRIHDAMVYALDENVGRVLKKLAEIGQEENTFIMFLNDNGGPVMKGTTVNASSNAPLRGGKRTTLEGGIRVPYLVSWKNHIKPRVYDEPVMQFDLTATALKLAGAHPANLDGVDLLPFFAGEKAGPPHKALYWRFGEQMAIRVGNYKLVRYDMNADSKTGKRHQPIVGPRLYDLSSDIGETKDLSAVMPDKLKELQTKWDAWNSTLMKPLWPFGKSLKDGDPGENKPRKKRKKIAAGS